MSENVILNWVCSLDSAAKRRLAVLLITRPAAPASTMLGLYATAQQLDTTEISGLLPLALVQSQAAADEVLGGMLWPTKASA